MRTVKVRVYRRNPSKRRKATRTTAKKRRHSRWGAVASHKRRVNPSRKRRTNPSRKRATRRRGTRRRTNPAMSLGRAISGDSIKKALLIGGGVVAGNQVTRLISTGTLFGRTLFTAPAFLSGSLRPAVGLITVILGAVVAKKARGASAKEFAIGLMAGGGADVIVSLVNIAKPGMLGQYVNEGMDAFRGPVRVGMQLNTNQSKLATALGRVGPRYGIPTRDVSLAGYDESAFSSVSSSFAAG